MMKYVITKEQSDRLENLQKMSLKRHAKKNQKGLKGVLSMLTGTLLRMIFILEPTDLYMHKQH